MLPLQISEPSSNEVVFGIDLGTTNSLIAMVNKAGSVEIFKDEKGRELLPSIISYESGILKVGYDVSENAICSIKRLMGKSIKDLCKQGVACEIDSETEKVVRVKCSEGKYLTPVEISAEILKTLCKRVKKIIGVKVNKAVISVPAYFDDSARNATKYAAKLAGIDVLYLINEPTAAALSYSIEKNNDTGIYAVYDLGGGTFDISILKLHKGVFQVLAVGGDTRLGGDDFDHLLSLIVLEKYRRELSSAEEVLDIQMSKYCSKKGITPAPISYDSESLLTSEYDEKLRDQDLVPVLSTRIKLSDSSIYKLQYSYIKNSIYNMRAVKEHLSKNVSGIFEFIIDDRLFKCKITREEFEQAISPLVNRSVNIVSSTISSIDLRIDDIKGIILVGGATRVPLVQKSLIKLFGNKVLSDVDPEKAVVNGAALQAYYLTSNPKGRNILLDVLPLSLGVETVGGIVENIIPRNTPLPVSEIKEFTTYVNGQTSMKIHVCQGEREMIKDNKSLALFELRGIPKLPAGSAKVQIEFTVAIDGILTVTAREKTTGIEQTVKINSSSGLSEEDIQNMVNQSVNNFDEDMKARSLAEAKINGNRLIHLVESVFFAEQRLEILLQNAKKALQGDELGNINDTIAELENFALKLLSQKIDRVHTTL